MYQLHYLARTEYSSSFATGASFTGLTVTSIVAVLLSVVPSFTLNVKLTGPSVGVLELSGGLYVTSPVEGLNPVSVP